jgi:hypothetical protein
MTDAIRRIGLSLAAQRDYTTRRVAPGRPDFRTQIKSYQSLAAHPSHSFAIAWLSWTSVFSASQEQP